MHCLDLLQTVELERTTEGPILAAVLFPQLMDLLLESSSASTIQKYSIKWVEEVAKSLSRLHKSRIFSYQLA